MTSSEKSAASTVVTKALEAGGTLLCTFDVKKRTLTMPKSYADSLGLPEVVENVPYAITTVVQGDKDNYVRFYESIINGSKTGEAVVQMRYADGSTRWKKSSFATEYDSDGKPIKAVITVRDITSEIIARIESERNSLLIENCGISVFDYDVKSDTLIYESTDRENRYYKKTCPDFLDFLKKSEFIHPKSYSDVQEILHRVSHKPENGSIELVGNIKGEGYRWCKVDYTAIANESGSVYRIVGIVTDIEEEKQRNTLVNDLNSRIGMSYDKITFDPIILMKVFQFLSSTNDLNEAVNHVLALIGMHYGVDRTYIFEDSKDRLKSTNTYEWCAEGAEPQKDKLVDIPYDNSVGVSFLNGFNENGTLSIEDIGEMQPEIRDFLAQQGIRSILLQTVTNNGERAGFIGFDDCNSLRKWTNEQKGTLSWLGKIIGMYLFRAKDREKLQKGATHDPLTELYNRTALQEKAVEVLENASPDDQFAMFMVDLDNFKTINDTLGHQCGDETLVKAAGVISKNVGDDGIAARIGGDEFIVFMTQNVSEKNACKKASELVKDLRSEMKGIDVTASVGVVVTKGGNQNFAELYRIVDEALYDAKHSGKNIYTVRRSDGMVIYASKPKRIVPAAAGENAGGYHDIGIAVFSVKNGKISTDYIGPGIEKDSDIVDHKEKKVKKTGEELLSIIFPGDDKKLVSELIRIAENGGNTDISFRIGKIGKSVRRLRGECIPQPDGRVQIVAVISSK